AVRGRTMASSGSSQALLGGVHRASGSSLLLLTQALWVLVVLLGEATGQGAVPLVPRCCPPGTAMKKGFCKAASTPAVFSPPVSPGPRMSPVEWKEIREVMAPLNCSTDYVHTAIDTMDTHIMALSTGTVLFWLSPKEHFIQSISTEFCVDVRKGTDGPNVYSAYFCNKMRVQDFSLDKPKPHCDGVSCVRKCCPAGFAMDYSIFRCIPSQAPLERHYPAGLIANKEPSDLPLATGYPKCKAYTVVPPEILHMEDYIHYNKSDHCSDNVVSSALAGVSNTLSVSCWFPSKPNTWMGVRAVLLPMCVIISCIFLLMMIVCHFLVPALRKNEGVYHLCHLISLFFAFIGFLIVFLGTNIATPGFCVFIVFVLHFFFLAIFFWLAVMVFDIWNKVNSLAAQAPLATLDIFWCHLFAWGCPALFVLVSVIVHFAVDRYNPDVLRPGIGEASCWFAGPTEHLVYFYGPIAIVVVVCIVFFIMSYLKYRTINQETMKIESRSEEPDTNNTSSGAQLQPCFDFKAEFTHNALLLALAAFWWLSEGLGAIPPIELWYVVVVGGIIHMLVKIIFLLQNKGQKS
ncbi:unnamed protein product, partial [Meganyctiphanes norvegica]